MLFCEIDQPVGKYYRVSFKIYDPGYASMICYVIY